MPTTRDVQFVIRARDEASRSLDAIADAIENLSGASGALGGGAANARALLNTLNGYGAAASKISAAADQAGAAYDRQTSKVAKLKAELAQVEQQSRASATAAQQVKAAGEATGNSDAAAAKIKAIEAAQAGLVRQREKLLGQITREEAGVEKLRSEYQRLASIANGIESLGPDVAAIQAQVAAAEGLADAAQTVREQVEAEAAARDKAAAAARREQEAAAAAIGAAAREVGKSEEAAARAAGALRDRIDPIGAVWRKANEEIGRAEKLLKSGAIDADEFAAAQRVINHEAQATADHFERINRAGNKKLPLGLKPYEWANLSYQINDVVTGLASGQRPMQVLAQQGGQILQLFPKVGSAIGAAFTNPAFLAAAAVFTAIGLAVREAANQADRLRQLSGVLKGNADGAAYSAKALEANTDAMRELHYTTAEAMETARAFVREGINPAYIVPFADAAKDLSRVLGSDLKSAVGDVAGAFTKGFQAVAALDDKTNFLTATEREHIRVLFDSGKAAEARQEAFDLFKKRMDEAADAMRGPWTKAIERLETSWERLKSSMSDSAFSNLLLKMVNNLAFQLEDLANRFGGAADKIATTLNEQGNSVVIDLNAPTDTKTDASEVSKKAQADARAEIKLARDAAMAYADKDRIRVAGEQAYRDEIQKSGDVAVATLRKQAAEARTLQEIQHGRRGELYSTAASFAGRREGNRQDNAILQELFKAAGMGNVDPAKVAWCAAFVNAILHSKGLPTSGSLAANSFSKYGTATANPEKGDIVVLKPQARGSSGHVGFFDSFDQNGNVRVLGGNQGKFGQVTTSTFKRNQVVSFRRPGNIGEGVEGLTAEMQTQLQLAQTQSDFNFKLKEENAARERAIGYMREQLGLSVQARAEAERKQAINEAVVAAERDAKERNLEFSAEQRKELEKTVGAQFDIAHAQEIVNGRLQEQQSLRDALLTGIADAQNRGDQATVTALTAQLDTVNAALKEAIEAADHFWSKFDSPEAKAARESLRQLGKQVADTKYTLMQGQLQSLERNAGGIGDLRGQLQGAIDNAQLSGNGAAARELDGQLTLITSHLVEANNKLIEFWRGVAGSPDALAAMGKTREQVEAIILGLQAANHEAMNMGTQFLMTGRQINESFADGATNAIDSFFQSVRDGNGVISSLWNAFLQFSSDFLRQIALMILKQTIFNAISGKNGSGGLGGAISGAVGSLFSSAAPLMTAGATLSAAGGTLMAAGGMWQATSASLMAAANMLIVANSMSAGLAHGGAIVGATSMSRSVSPSIFAGAARYHTGGIAGLKPDEVPTILQRNEEVITRNDPRHRMNGGRGGSGAVEGGEGGISLVGLFNPEDVPAALANSKSGTRTLVAMFSGNRQQFRQALGMDE